VERIYLDHNATTPLAPEVREAMLPHLGALPGNASSVHWFGQRARRAVDRARQQVAALINADPQEIVFCSGGTEADNLALGGVLRLRRGKLVISAIEHPAVLEAAQAQRRAGAEVELVPVDASARVDPDAVADAVDEATRLVSVMLANNDVGTIQPVQQIAERLRGQGALLHSDAVQAAGKIPIDVHQLGVDLLSLSAHKLYGPQGVGALYLRRGLELAPLLWGGGQERRRRAGTENVAGIVGFGAACELAAARQAEDRCRLTTLRDRLESQLLRTIADVRVNGDRDHRLPNTLNVAFAGVDGATLLINLDLAGIAVSVGSACASGKVGPSHVLKAMGLSDTQALSALRFSLGRGTRAAEIERVLAVLAECVPRLRAEQR
jgi:cysteine desulfurase